MSQASAVAEQLIQAWIKDPHVNRIAHDDDGLTDSHGKMHARMRPNSDLAKAAAVCLQGFGALMPVGDGSYLVTWEDGR